MTIDPLEIINNFDESKVDSKVDLEKFIPIKASFHISNLNHFTDIVLSNIVVEHELKTIVFNNRSPSTKSTFWGVSSGTFLYSKDNVQTTDMNFMAAKKEDEDKIIEEINRAPEIKIEFETIPVLDLGLYSNTEDNVNFKLVTQKQVVKPNSIEYFQFRFFISKEVLKKYTSMLPMDEEIYEFNDDYEEYYVPTSQLNLLSGENDTYSIEDITDLRLKLTVLLSAAASNGEFAFIRYFNYQ